MEEVIKKIYELKQLKEQAEARITADTQIITQLEEDIKLLSKDLLNAMKDSNLNELEVDNIKAGYFKRENIGYTSDADVLNWLKEHGFTNFIKTKVTESLDKTPLKKAIKTDSVLAEALESMTVRTLTEYVVVTSKDNYEAMLEHMSK